MIKLKRNDLMQLESTQKVDAAFLSYLSQENREKILNCRTNKDNLSDSDLVQLARILQSFLVHQFDLDLQFANLQHQETTIYQAIQFHQSIVKLAARKLKTATFDQAYVDCVDQFLKENKCHSEEQLVSLWQASEIIDDFWIDWCQFVIIDQQDPYCQWSMFKLPQRVDFDQLVTAIPIEARSDFSVIPATLSVTEVSKHVHYCIVCHHKENDSCAKGLVSRKSKELKVSPLGRTLSGCPLNQKISQMHELRQSNDLLAALSVIMMDNPLCFLTGDRICNDCMASCIYQKFTPVDTPSVESDTLKKILSLPFGAELYLLLARWNPLKPEGFIHSSKKLGSLAVVGMGPAGIAMSYYGLMNGAVVLGLDGLPIDIDADPLRPIHSFIKWADEFNQGRPLGFGGVADYGITVRWDKRYLALAWVLLARFNHFQLLGNVRLGGSITLSQLKEMGFDQVVLATGAGLPQALMIQDLQGMFFANEFLMRLHLSGMLNKNFDDGLCLPIRVIGGGLTAVDAATEAQVAYIKWVQQVDFWVNASPRFLTEFRDQVSPCDQDRLQCWIRDGEAIRQSKGCNKKNLSIILQSGGVSILYRRRMQDSPAYKTNFIELEKALEQGIQYVEKVEVTEALADERGHVKALVCQIAGEISTLAAKTVLVATGSKPNVAYYYEHRHEIEIEQGFYKRSGRFTLASNDLPDFVSAIGDLHPEYHGSVVNALASAKDACSEVIGRLHSGHNVCLLSVVDQLKISFINVHNIGYGLIQLELDCHQQLSVGAYLNIHVMTKEGLRNQLSAIVFDQERNQLKALVNIDQDGIDDLLSRRIAGIMGPSGTRILPKSSSKNLKVFADKRGLMWALVLASAGKKVGVSVHLYTDVIISDKLKTLFISVIHVPSWQDISFKNDSEYDLYYCLSAEIIKVCQENLVIKAKSIYGMVHGSMMCALKGICGQCIQWQMGPEGRIKAVYACSWPNQPVELIDLEHLSMRQSKAPLGKKLERTWRENQKVQSLLEE